MKIVVRCPKCYVYRAADDKNKTWRCYRCNYSMNKKNTKIQGRANNIEEVMHIMRLLKEGKV